MITAKPPEPTTVDDLDAEPEPGPAKDMFQYFERLDKLRRKLVSNH